jgi:hypothetical protein
VKGLLIPFAVLLGACTDDAADEWRARADSLERTLAEKQMLFDTRESRQEELVFVRKMLNDTAPLTAAELKRALPLAKLATERSEGFSRAWVFVGGSRDDLLATLEAAGNLHAHVIVSIIEWGPGDWTLTLLSVSPDPPKREGKQAAPGAEARCTGRCAEQKARVESLRVRVAALEAELGEVNLLPRLKKEADERLRFLDRYDHALLQQAYDLVGSLDPPRTMQLRLAPHQFDLR